MMSLRLTLAGVQNLVKRPSLSSVIVRFGSEPYGSYGWKADVGAICQRLSRPRLIGHCLIFDEVNVRPQPDYALWTRTQFLACCLHTELERPAVSETCKNKEKELWLRAIRVRS